MPLAVLLLLGPLPVLLLALSVLLGPLAELTELSSKLSELSASSAPVPHHVPVESLLRLHDVVKL